MYPLGKQLDLWIFVSLFVLLFFLRLYFSSFYPPRFTPTTQKTSKLIYRVRDLLIYLCSYTAGPLQRWLGVALSTERVRKCIHAHVFYGYLSIFRSPRVQIFSWDEFLSKILKTLTICRRRPFDLNSIKRGERDSSYQGCAVSNNVM